MTTLSSPPFHYILAGREGYLFHDFFVYPNCCLISKSVRLCHLISLYHVHCDIQNPKVIPQVLRSEDAWQISYKNIIHNCVTFSRNVFNVPLQKVETATKSLQQFAPSIIPFLLSYPRLLSSLC